MEALFLTSETLSKSCRDKMEISLVTLNNSFNVNIKIVLSYRREPIVRVTC